MQEIDNIPGEISREEVMQFMKKQATKTPRFSDASPQEFATSFMKQFAQYELERLLSPAENGAELVVLIKQAEDLAAVGEKVLTAIFGINAAFRSFLHQVEKDQEQVRECWAAKDGVQVTSEYALGNLSKIPEANFIYINARKEFEGFEPAWFLDEEKSALVVKAWRREVSGALEDKKDLDGFLKSYISVTKEQASFIKNVLDGVEAQEVSIAGDKGKAAIKWMSDSTDTRALSLYSCLHLSERIAMTVHAEMLCENLSSIRSELQGIVPERRPETSAEKVIDPAASLSMR